VSEGPTMEETNGGRDMETEGPFMKRDVKGSVTGPTSVSMSPPVISLLSPPPFVHSCRQSLVPQSFLHFVSSGGEWKGA